MSKLILLDHPWQTEIGLGFSKIATRDPSVNLVLVDFFSILYHQDLVRKVAEQGFMTATQEDNFYKWNRLLRSKGHVHSETHDSKDSLWDPKFSKHLIHTNQYLNFFERSRYMNPLKDCCKEAVVRDSFLWLEKIIIEWGVKEFFCLERTTMEFNILRILSDRMKIRLRYLIPSRIEKRQVLLNGPGLVIDLKSAVSKNHISEQSITWADNFISEKRSSLLGTYDVWNGNRFVDISTFKNQGNVNHGSFLSITKEFWFWCKKVVPRIREYLHLRSAKVVLFQENKLKLMFFELLVILRKHFNSLYYKVNFIKAVCDVKTNNFVWFLQTRPEGVAQILSNNLDELEMIKSIASKLPAEYELYVKEHPMMLGIRDRKFYLELGAINNVKIVDARVNPLLMLQKARGVIGLSGSSLLEAEILGVPTLVLGQPEFSQICRFRGLPQLTNFLEFCRTNHGFQITEELRQYIALIYSHSGPNDLREGVEFSDDALTLYCHEILRRIDKDLGFDTEPSFS